MILLSKPAAVAGTTWNPADKDSSVTLSSANALAAGNATDAFRSVRSTTSKSAGKIYHEVQMTLSPGGATTWMCGIMNSLAGLGSYPGADANGVGVYPWTNATGGFYYNGAITNMTAISSGGATSGKTLGVALDLSAAPKLLWATIDGTTWNNGGTASPATGVGGFTITPSGPFFIAWGGGTNSGISAQATIRPQTSGFVFPIPSGFSPWDPG
jgi:hypothetical protein